MPDCVAKSLNAIIGAVRFVAADRICRFIIKNYAVVLAATPMKISLPSVRHVIDTSIGRISSLDNLKWGSNPSPSATQS